MKFAAILFDLDGTLVDSEKLWLQAEIEFVEAYGKQYDPVLHSQLHGVSAERTAELMQTIYDLDVDSRQIFSVVQRHVKHLLKTQLQMKPGAEELLAHVQQAGIPAALVSNSSHEIVMAVLENRAWASVFRVVCPREAAKNAKPAPDLYLHAAQQLGVDPRDCLIIEDSLTGVTAAVAAGATCYAVPEDHHYSVFQAITPHVFDSLLDVYERIRS